MILFIICILLFLYLLLGVNYPFNFNEILSVINSNSLLFENATDKRSNQKLLLVKINMTMSKNFVLR